MPEQEEVQKFSDDLQQLQRLRATATQVERPSEEARGSLLRYTLQLEALEPVFPVSETEVGRVAAVFIQVGAGVRAAFQGSLKQQTRFGDAELLPQNFLLGADSAEGDSL